MLRRLRWEFAVAALACASCGSLASGATGDLLLTLKDPMPAGPGWTQGFGLTIAGSGANIVVGAPYDDVGNFGNAGSLMVFSATTGDFLRRITDPQLRSN